MKLKQSFLESQVSVSVFLSNLSKIVQQKAD